MKFVRAGSVSVRDNSLSRKSALKINKMYKFKIYINLGGTASKSLPYYIGQAFLVNN